MLRDLLRAFLLQEGADGQLIEHVLILCLVALAVLTAGTLLVLKIRAAFAQLSETL